MKVLSFVVGLVLLGAIVYIGYYTSSHSNFVIWFGVSTAILAPLAFEFLFLPFKSQNSKLIKDLSKVPQIEKLIKEAEDNEQKVKLLEQQRAELDRLVSYESKRRALLAEKKIFIYQGEAALKGLNRVDQSLLDLTGEKESFPESLHPLMEKIKHGEPSDVPFTFNGKQHTLRKSDFDGLPGYGVLFFELAKVIVRALDKMENPNKN
jgi:DNA-binding MarR family transcriptional regulator